MKKLINLKRIFSVFIVLFSSVQYLDLLGYWEDMTDGSALSGTVIISQHEDSIVCLHCPTL